MLQRGDLLEGIYLSLHHQKVKMQQRASILIRGYLNFKRLVGKITGIARAK
jgi:hypothetical protein